LTRHKATHVIHAGLFGNMPKWLNEGLSECFELLAVREQSGIVEFSPQWHQSVMDSWRQNKLIPLNTYFRMNGNDWSHYDSAQTYGVVWSLVHLMLSDNYRKNIFTSMLKELADNYCAPFDTTVFLNTRYDGGARKLERDWKQWLNHGLHSAHIY